MGVVKLNKLLLRLDNNISEIKKLNFLGFNLWKMYRLHFVAKFNKSTHTSKKQSIYTMRNIFTIIKSFKDSRGKIFFRVHSGIFNEVKNDKYFSNRINVIKQSLKLQGFSSFLFGIISQEKKDNLLPEINLSDSFIGYYSNKLRYICLLFVILPTVRHFRSLQTFSDISFRQVLNIQITFLSRYIIWYIYYIFAKPKKVLFVFASYGCEAEIAVLKRLKIEILEYQHGHLYCEHYGYNYNKSLKDIKDKLLLPDKFFVYGQYWKDLLLKMGFYDENELLIFGNPSFENIEKLNITKTDKIPILVCSQPNSAKLFMKFIENYNLNSEFKDSYYWIIKLHPREVLGDWEEFINQNKNIELSNNDTYSLLKTIDIHLTGSSSTLYEALYFSVSNYILLNDLKINDSKNFDNNIGKIIDNNYVDKFICFGTSYKNKYFDNFNMRLDDERTS